MQATNSSNGAATELAAEAVRIVLVEDHVILRDGLRSLLELESEFQVVGEAASCDAGIEVVKALAPDLVITDIGLPGRSGLTLIPEIKQVDRKIKVLVLTAHCVDEYVREALKSGADGYVLKDASRADLMTGIRSVLQGQQYFSTLVTSRMVTGFIGRPADGRREGPAKITPREEEVMTLIAAANSTKEIAAKLELSVKTVEKHRSNLMRKLELHSTAEVTLYAVRHNYVSVNGDFQLKSLS